MNTEQSIAFVLNMAGVEGSYIVSDSGDIIGQNMPSMFDELMLKEIATNAINVLETFRSEIESCNEIQLDMELKSLYVKSLLGSLIFILISDTSQQANIRIACNVVAKRYDPATDVMISKPDLTKEESKSGAGKGIWGE